MEVQKLIDIFILFIFFPYPDTQPLLYYAKEAAGPCSLVSLFFSGQFSRDKNRLFFQGIQVILVRKINS